VRLCSSSLGGLVAGSLFEDLFSLEYSAPLAEVIAVLEELPISSVAGSCAAIIETIPAVDAWFRFTGSLVDSRLLCSRRTNLSSFKDL
jgi:hypothetical protein